VFRGWKVYLEVIIECLDVVNEYLEVAIEF